MSWRQGWRPLEPLVTTHFGKSSFRNYINDTLQERSPRLVVMECLAKHWFTCTQPMPHRNNTARQKEKKIREAINPFLSVAQQVAQAQLDDGHDFLFVFKSFGFGTL